MKKTTYRIGTDYGAGDFGERPGEGDLAHLPRTFLGELYDAVDDLNIRVPALFLKESAIDAFSARSLCADRASEMSIHERRISHDANALVLAVGE